MSSASLPFWTEPHATTGASGLLANIDRSRPTAPSVCASSSSCSRASVASSGRAVPFAAQRPLLFVSGLPDAPSAPAAGCPPLVLPPVASSGASSGTRSFSRCALASRRRCISARRSVSNGSSSAAPSAGAKSAIAQNTAACRSAEPAMYPPLSRSSASGAAGAQVSCATSPSFIVNGPSASSIRAPAASSIAGLAVSRPPTHARAPGGTDTTALSASYRTSSTLSPPRSSAGSTIRGPFALFAPPLARSPRSPSDRDSPTFTCSTASTVTSHDSTTSTTSMLRRTSRGPPSSAPRASQRFACLAGPDLAGGGGLSSPRSA